LIITRDHLVTCCVTGTMHIWWRGEQAVPGGEAVPVEAVGKQEVGGDGPGDIPKAAENFNLKPPPP